MSRIRCHYLDCVFLDDRFCEAVSVEFDPDSGCLTYTRSARMLADVWHPGGRVASGRTRGMLADVWHPGGRVASADDGWDDEDELDENWEERGFQEKDAPWLDDDDDDF
ncbi:MAG: hypothetical protein ACE5GO_07335 [Anaerolineales bacterium]